jgi:hypothetical protein
MEKEEFQMVLDDQYNVDEGVLEELYLFVFPFRLNSLY